MSDYKKLVAAIRELTDWQGDPLVRLSDDPSVDEVVFALEELASMIGALQENDGF
jgi:hypothetical protein